MTTYQKANLDLIAKSISELHFEEILTNLVEHTDHNYSLNLSCGVSYFFHAHYTIWQTLVIDPLTIKRKDQLKNIIQDASNLLAAQFFLDIQKEMDINDITMAHFLEEMHHTLFSEATILEKIQSLSFNDHIHIATSVDQLQFYLSGHPKILLNKGRMGFGAEALKKYAPENERPMKFFWLLVHNALPVFSHPRTVSTNNQNLYEHYFFNNCFSIDDQNNLKNLIKDLSLNPNDYTLFPVHPWQYDRYIAIHYALDIAMNKIIPFKRAGALYQPQISLRTFMNTENAKACDIKVSLTVLNTSAYRGISTAGVESSYELSDFLTTIISNDPFFHHHPTHVLKEITAASIPHPHYSMIKAPPYRYNEMLGYVVRESHHHYLNKGEWALMSGAFFLKDKVEQSLIGQYIKHSKITVDQWIEAYTKNVILPLYHLQLSHGIGLVSHGQNIVVKFKNFCPSGVFLKDFQGDLRFSTDPTHKKPEKLKAIKTLPPEYLIHDLFTGHFLTVWRFISPLLEKEGLISENKIYNIMAKIIGNYLKDYHPVIYLNPYHPLNLLRPKMEKIILNKVRFSLGYQDSEMRPLPLTGTPLDNPLALQEQQNENI